MLARWERAAREGAAEVGPQTPAGLRLTDSADFFAFLQREMPALLVRWREQRSP
jgi:hypothetical protein